MDSSSHRPIKEVVCPVEAVLNSGSDSWSRDPLPYWGPSSLRLGKRHDLTCVLVPTSLSRSFETRSLTVGHAIKCPFRKPVDVKMRGSAIIRLVIAIFGVNLTLPRQTEVVGTWLDISIFDDGLLLGANLYFGRRRAFARVKPTFQNFSGLPLDVILVLDQMRIVGDRVFVIYTHMLFVACKGKRKSIRLLGQ